MSGDRAEGLAEHISRDGMVIRTKAGLKENPLLKHEIAARSFIVSYSPPVGTALWAFQEVRAVVSVLAPPHQPELMRKVSWPLHESGWRHLSRSFDRAMQWHCHLPMAPSMRP